LYKAGASRQQHGGNTAAAKLSCPAKKAVLKPTTNSIGCIYVISSRNQPKTANIDCSIPLRLPANTDGQLVALATRESLLGCEGGLHADQLVKLVKAHHLIQHTLCSASL
jgi:hypothetical protein